MRLFHIFKMAPHQREAVCGFTAQSDPQTVQQDKAYPRCEACMMWFKSLCWKAEPSPTKGRDEGET